MPGPACLYVLDEAGPPAGSMAAEWLELHRRLVALRAELGRGPLGRLVLWAADRLARL